MIDRVSADGRMAQLRPLVIHASPNWAFEIFACIVCALVIVMILTLGQLGVAINAHAEALEEADFWHELALAPDTMPTVRLAYDGSRYTCAAAAIAPAWQAAVDAECEVMGELLRMARAPN